MYLLQFIRKQTVLVTLILFILSGCKLGPNFHRPHSPQTPKYIQDVRIDRTTGNKQSNSADKAQYVYLGQNIPAQWWQVFHSPELNHLIIAGLANSPNLAAAKAALTQAQENYRAIAGSLYPTITGSFLAQRQRFNFSQFGESNNGPIRDTIFNFYYPNLALAYTVDVFGKVRRQIEAAGAQVAYQQFELEAAFLTLASNIASTFVAISSLDAQITATNALIHYQEKTLRLVKQQFTLGGVSKSDILLQENQLAQSKATLPPLKQNLQASQHLLSLLVGELPREHALPVLGLDKLHLPSDLPLSCPSLLTRQRPDVRAAESLLHTASAQIGVATANLFPQLILSGNYGQQSISLDNLFSPQNNVWSISGQVAQTIFSGGTLRAQRRAAIAAYEQSAAQYKQTVLQAFQNVADVLRALQNDAQLSQDQKQAEFSALESLTLIQKQFRLGGVNYLQLLTAQRAYQQAKINRIQAQSARYMDTIALFQALGGGWWNRCVLNCDPLIVTNTAHYTPEVFGRG